MNNKSRIQADAVGQGGMVDITADAFVKSGDSDVTASSERNLPGTVEIKAPDTDFLESLAPLAVEFEDPGSRLGDRCSRRRDVEQSKLSIGVRDGLPLGPDVYFLGPTKRVNLSERQGGMPRSERLAAGSAWLTHAGATLRPCR